MISPEICGAQCPLSSLEDPDELLKALEARHELARKFRDRGYVMQLGLISEMDPTMIALDCLAKREEGTCPLVNMPDEGVQ